jgi:hypothetical protein
MTLNSELVTEIRALINDTTDNPIPHLDDVNILSFMQRAVNELCIESDVNYRAYAYTHSGLPISSISFIDLTGGVEEDLYKLNELSIKTITEDYFKPLKRVNYTKNEVIKDFDSDNVYSCHIYNKTIYFNSNINAGDIILITARWKKPNLVLGNDFPLDSISEDCVIKYSSAIGYFTMNKLDLGNIWFAQYTYRKDQIVKYYKELINEKDPSAVSVIKNSNSILYNYNMIKDL